MIVPYCERLQFGVEPVNTASNAAFLIAGAVMLVMVKRLIERQASLVNVQRAPATPAASARGNGEIVPLTAWQQRGLWCLAVLPMAIAAGSAAFHASPSRLTQILDVAPIAAFVLLGVALLLRLRYRLDDVRIGALLALWLAATVVAAQKPDWLAGSLFYVPTAVTLTLLALTARGNRRSLISCATVFMLAWIARTLDVPLCSTWYGLHALWHILTAMTCILALGALGDALSARSALAQQHRQAQLRR